MKEENKFFKNITQWTLFCPKGGQKLVEGAYTEKKIPPLVFKEDPPLKGSVLFVEGVPQSESDLAPFLAWEKQTQGMVCFISTEIDLIAAFFKSSFSEYFLSLKNFYIYYLEEENVYEEAAMLATLFGLKIEVFFGTTFLFEQFQRAYRIGKENFNAVVGESLNGGLSFFNNFYRNLFLLHDITFFSGLKNAFKDVPAVIVGAGPSLEKNFEVLKELENKALIFAGGTSFTALEGFNVTPNFGLGVDPHAFQWTRVIQSKAIDTPYFFLSRFFNLALTQLQTPLIYAGGSSFSSFHHYINKELGIKEEEIDGGRGVINFSISMAAFLGCNPIVLTGLDLSYAEGSGYASSIKNHPLHPFPSNFHTKREDEPLILRKDIYGNPVYSLSKWILEAEWIGRFQIEHPSLSLINATEGGIGFYGIPNFSLRETASLHMQRKWDLKGMIHKGLEECKKSLSSEKIKKCLKDLLDNFKKTLLLLEEAVEKKETTLSPLLEKEPVFKNYLKETWDIFLSYFVLGFQILEDRFGTDEERKNKKEEVIFFGINNLIRIAKDQIKTLENVLEINKEVFFDEKENRRNAFFSEEEKHIPKDGIKEIYSSEQNLLSRVVFKEGNKEGNESLFYREGSLYCERKYVKGKIEGPFVYYYPNGKVKAKGAIYGGKLEGCLNFFYENGAEKASFYFKQGKKEGEEKRFWPNGKPLLQAFYREGNPYGMLQEWDEKGVLIKELLYNKESKLLKETRKNEKGELVLEDAYTNFFDSLAQKSENLEVSLIQLNKMFGNVLSMYGLEEDKAHLQEEMIDLKEKKEDLIKILLQKNEGLPEKEQIEKEIREQLQGMGDHLKDQMQEIESFFKKINQSL